MTDPMLARALTYHRARLCVLPATVKQKRPALTGWKRYQKRLPTEDELRQWFASKPDAICVVTGTVSGNLEMLDFDANGELFPTWAALVESRTPELLDRLVRETSQSGGKHVCYRCEDTVPGNTKLAERIDGVAVIETRGEGGLFLCAPTPGYEIESKALLDAVPVLTAKERATLIDCAQTLSEVPSDARGTTRSTSAGGNGDRPGDDYNEHGDVPEVLKSHGWTLVRGGANELWRRPGKGNNGWSASFNGKVFYCFSSNATPFKPSQGYAPFAVYTLLEHRGDFVEAAAALRRKPQNCGNEGETRNFQAGDDGGSSGVDLSGIVGQFGSEEEAEEQRHSDPGAIPEELLRVPGFIDEVMAYTLETAPYPQPVLAFCGALALQAFLSGRKVRDPGDNRTNLYLLALANTGVGKDKPRRTNQEILLAVGLQNGLGDAFASGEGIEDRLHAHPSVLLQTDEINTVIAAIRDEQEQRFEVILQILLRLYSSANGIYPVRIKADQQARFIDQPSLTLFGTAIPKIYYEALSARLLTNGFFSRTMILEAGQRGEGQVPVMRELPASIIETAKWWADFHPGGGNLNDWHPVPRVIEQTPEAAAGLSALRKRADREYSSAEKRDDGVSMAVWSRATEKARRLALVYACSENHENPTITKAAVNWAGALADNLTRRMLFMASGYVSENPFDAMCLKVIRKLKDAPKVGLPHSVLLKHLRKDAGTFQQVIETLEQRGDVASREVTTARRPARWYCLTFNGGAAPLSRGDGGGK